MIINNHRGNEMDKLKDGMTAEQWENSMQKIWKELRAVEFPGTAFNKSVQKQIIERYGLELRDGIVQLKK